MKKWVLATLAALLVVGLLASAAVAGAQGGDTGKGAPQIENGHPHPLPPPVRLGVLVAELTPERAEKLGIDYQPGVVVVRVLPGSPALGKLEAKDIIVAAGGSPVASPAELKQAVKAAEAEISLTVVRPDGEMEITVSLEDGFIPRPFFRLHRLLRPAPGWLGLLVKLPGVKELKEIPPQERFSHFQGGEFSFTDKEGNPLTVRLVPGEVREVSDKAITIITNSGDEASFAINEETRGGKRVPHLQAGERVVVVTVDDEAAARAVLTMKALRRSAQPKGKWGGPWLKGNHGFRPFPR